MLDTPMTHRMLKMHEPMMLPTAMSVCPLRAAMTEAKSSGRLVPTATTVSPMMRSICVCATPKLLPSAMAMLVAPSTRRFAPSTMAASARRTKRMAFQSGMMGLSSSSSVVSGSVSMNCFGLGPLVALCSASAAAACCLLSRCILRVCCISHVM